MVEDGVTKNDIDFTIISDGKINYRMLSFWIDSPRETTVQDAINNKQFSDTTVCPPVPSELLK